LILLKKGKMEEKPLQNPTGPPFRSEKDSEKQPVAAAPSAAALSSKRGYALPEPSPQEVTMGPAGVAAPSAAATEASLKSHQQQQQHEQQKQNDPPLKRQKVSSSASFGMDSSGKSSQSNAAAAADDAATTRMTTVTYAAASATFAAVAVGSETPPVKTPDTAMESMTPSREDEEAGIMESHEDGDNDQEVVALLQQQAQHDQQNEEEQEEHHKQHRHMSQVQRSTSTGSVASDLSSPWRIIVAINKNKSSDMNYHRYQPHTCRKYHQLHHPHQRVAQDQPLHGIVVPQLLQERAYSWVVPHHCPFEPVYKMLHCWNENKCS
jgi:hypothetical protein